MENNSTWWMILVIFLISIVTLLFWVFKHSAFVQAATDAAKKEYQEAGDEIHRIVSENDWGRTERIQYFVIAFIQAKQCTERYLAAAKAGGRNIACTCGLHPSRGGKFQAPSP